MARVLFIVFVLILFGGRGHADDNKKLKKKELIEQADYYFFKENFPKALELYQKILDNYPKNHYVQYHQYVAHHLTDGRGEDLSGLKEFEENEGQTDKFYNYWLGRIHHSRYEFDLAVEHFEAFLALDVYRTKEILRESEQRLADAIYAREYYGSPNEFEVELLNYPINSQYSDLSPAFFADHDELLFVSSRPATRNLNPDKLSFRVFHTKKIGSKWGYPNLIEELGTLHESHPVIEMVNDDGKLFLYDSMSKDLRFSEPIGDAWSSPMEFNSDLKNRHIASHFFINDRENLIFFSTLTPKGNLDIYQTHYIPETGTWEDPFPVLGSINTGFDEDSPFLSHDGNSLYFSSDRPESMGGYDIFKCEWDHELQTWGEPTNLGFPTNTIDDEVNFQLNEDNISGFFSSNRIHGKGDFDIYHFHKKGIVLASGAVINEENGQLLRKSKVVFHPSKYLDESFTSISDANGFYQCEIFEDESFVAEILVNDQVVHTENLISSHKELKKAFVKDFYVKVPDFIEEKKDFTTLYDASKPEPQYEKVSMLGNKFRTGEKAMLRNIYFDLESAHLKKESRPMLASLLKTMKESSSLRVQIEGHTDNTGSASANLKLSKSRAESVKAYLVRNGISSSRITTKGFGASQPLASNDDEEDGRELNRRIEVRVIY